MALDLSLEESGGRAELMTESAWANPPGVRSGPSAGAGEELIEAHQILLSRLDEIRTLAERIEGRARSVESLLGPAETALRRQGEAQERAMQTLCASVERHWGETAARYRSLADELSRRSRGGPAALGFFERLKVALGGFLVGATLAVVATLYLSAHPRELREAVGLSSRPAASKALPADAAARRR